MDHIVGPEMQSRLLSVMRIMIGVVYLQSGTGKFLRVPPAPMFVNVASGSLPWWGGVVELACGTLIVLGLLTRPAAFLASGEAAVAYFWAHAGRSFFPAINGGSLAVMFCFAFFYLAVAGGGAWSLDRLLRERGWRYWWMR